MDPPITAAVRALSAGEPLAALKWVALPEDPPALALRGIAMAQLGDLVRAKQLLRSASRGFGPNQAMARALCLVAKDEIALVLLDLSGPVEKPGARHGRRLSSTASILRSTCAKCWRRSPITP